MGIYGQWLSYAFIHLKDDEGGDNDDTDGDDDDGDDDGDDSDDDNNEDDQKLRNGTWCM